MGAACSKVTLEKPEGFAVVKSSKYYKAVSPEGMVYKVRFVKNYPEKDLDFWSRALKKQLEQEGYRFIKEQSFTSGKKPGLILEWGAPYGTDDFIYLTAISVSGKTIIIAEAAAEFKLFTRYRDAVVKSLTTIKVN